MRIEELKDGRLGTYDSATVPNTDPSIVQLFLFDCDGNGVEIGNVDESMPAFDPEQTTLATAIKDGGKTDATLRSARVD